jgi:hypothetical protein
MVEYLINKNQQIEIIGAIYAIMNKFKKTTNFKRFSI